MHRADWWKSFVVGQMERFRRKDLLEKWGCWNVWGYAFSHWTPPTHLTVVPVYVYVRVDVRQGIPLHILPTTVKTGVVCRPSEPGWGTRKPLPHVSPGQPPLAMKQINSLRQSELRKRGRGREKGARKRIDSKRMEEGGRERKEDGGRRFSRGVVIGWSCSESREMISIEVEADNASPFYLLACLPPLRMLIIACERDRDQISSSSTWWDVMGKVWGMASFDRILVEHLNFVGRVSIIRVSSYYYNWNFPSSNNWNKETCACIY